MKQVFEIVPIEDYSRDLQLVDQVGYIDLREAFLSGVVPGDVDSDSSSYNGIDDPNSIIGSPDDVFAADRAAKAYNSAASSVSSEATEGA